MFKWLPPLRTPYWITLDSFSQEPLWEKKKVENENKLQQLLWAASATGRHRADAGGPLLLFLPLPTDYRFTFAYQDYKMRYCMLLFVFLFSFSSNHYQCLVLMIAANSDKGLEAELPHLAGVPINVYSPF